MHLIETSKVKEATASVKMAIFWDAAPCGLADTDVSMKLTTPVIKVISNNVVVMFLSGVHI